MAEWGEKKKEEKVLGVGPIPRNILIISQTKGYLESSLITKLESMDYIIYSAKCNPSSISATPVKPDFVFTFVDEALLAESQGMVYLKDVLTEEEIPMYVTGDAEMLVDFSRTIPKASITKEFARPINVSEVSIAIDEFMRSYASYQKKKILLVDDNGTTLRNIKGWLDEKYTVVPCNSGTRAIKYLATNKPDLILLDYEMPVVDGKQVLEMIRSENDLQAIPVIFLTGKSDRESVMQVMSLKPEGYLLKTMPPEHIIASINEFFEKQRITSQTKA